MSYGQFLSKLHVTGSDPVFTTYAAPMSRSHYKNDQAYQLSWTDAASAVELISNDGPNLGLGFVVNNRQVISLEEYYQQPVITTTYSDLVRFTCRPAKDLRLEVVMAVYSSESVIIEYRLINEGRYQSEVTVMPWFYVPSTDSINRVSHADGALEYQFPLFKTRDSWMKEHGIPFCERFKGYWRSTLSFDSVMTFSRQINRQRPKNLNGKGFETVTSLINKRRRSTGFINGLVASEYFRIGPGEMASFRILLTLEPPESRESSSQTELLEMDLNNLIADDEKAYSLIPRLRFADRSRELLYWNAFSLMRQCMMPPEGMCHFNYYVFSREPKWGWGYGGQVFHESLAMTAYALMDPEGAMNSQRVFMERQRPDGYINYRTGPYLDETIITGGKPTSSAPWFSYENLEIFRITRDQKFLEEAYRSGSRLYRYFADTRDSNRNGLCAWGGHAELESVRDARVAVWDRVGWAANFEGPDLNSMLVMEAASLAVMAGTMGLHEEARSWDAEAKIRSKLINGMMWDSVTQFYYNINKSDGSFTYRNKDDLKIREIIGFLPLWAGVADTARACLLVAKMLDTTEFWRPYGIPSLTAQSDYYCPIGYWNGPVWVQWNYLIYRGLKDYGYHNVADALSERVITSMIHHLRKDHDFWEFYSADDLQVGWNRSYIWAAIVVAMMREAQND